MSTARIVARRMLGGALAAVVVTAVAATPAQAAGASARLSLTGTYAYQYIELDRTVTVTAGSTLLLPTPSGIEAFDQMGQADNYSLLAWPGPARVADTDVWSGTLAPPVGEYDAFLPGRSTAFPDEYSAFRFHLVVTSGAPATTTLDLTGGAATRMIEDAAPEATVARGARFTYTAPAGVDLTGATVRLGRNIKAGESSIVFPAVGDLGVVATASSVSFTVPDPVVLDHEDDAPEVWDTYGDQRLLVEVTVPSTVPTAIGPEAGEFRTALRTEKDLPFSDVAGDGDFAGDIGWLMEQGITGGYADGTFRPSAPVSRQAMAAFLYRFAGEPVFTAPGTPTFADVPGSSSFYDEVEWLADSGVTTGSGRNGVRVFSPATAVSRQAMAAFLYRFAGEPAFTAPATPTFADVPASSSFYDEVEWLASTGVTTGSWQFDGSRVFKPAASVSRQAMAAFLHRFSALS